jgi:hypothetical protein
VSANRPILDSAGHEAERRGWSIDWRGPRLLKLAHPEIEAAFPAIQNGDRNGAFWFTLDFWIQRPHGGLGVFWKCNRVRDRGLREQIVEAMLNDESTGLRYHSGQADYWRAKGEFALAGKTISGPWWPRAGTPDMRLAQQSFESVLETWEQRVPAMIAAYRAIGIARPASGPTAPMNNEPPRARARAGEDWTRAEVSAVVDSYLGMLITELAHESFSKTEARRALVLKLPDRSEGSIEFKYANISAVLKDLGWPYVTGYKPRGNYQQLLAEVVERHLDQHPQVLEALNGVGSPPAPAVVRIADILAEPPTRKLTAGTPPRALRRLGAKAAELDAENKTLGTAGERFVLELERAELLQVGRADLASRVEWVAQTLGDGLGYDIHSYEPDGTDRRIEVKTTCGEKARPFYITPNELAVSQQFGNTFALYRLFNFSSQPRLFILRGALEGKLALTPVSFRAQCL